MPHDDNIVILISKDGDEHEIPYQIAKLSKLISETIIRNDEKPRHDFITEVENNNADSRINNEICLSTIQSQTLEKVIEYCTYYAKVESMTPIPIPKTPFKTNIIQELVQEWYADFINVDKNLLFEMTLAANFLDIKPMLELCCLGVTKLIAGRSEDNIRTVFNIANRPFPPKQIEAVRKENEWAFVQKLKFDDERTNIIEDL